MFESLRPIASLAEGAQCKTLKRACAARKEAVETLNQADKPRKCDRTHVTKRAVCFLRNYRPGCQ